MSFFQPTNSNPKAASVLAAPIISFKGQWADVNFTPAIMGAVLTLGIMRIGGDAIVQDLHAGATGVLLLMAGFAAYLILSALFKRGETKEYATTGIFKFSRNPAYLAFFAPLASLAYFDAITAMAATVIYVTLMNLFVIQKEEHELQNTFGKSFTAYRAATPRWFA